MKKFLFSLLLVAFGVSAMAQQRIQLRSADRAECTKSDMRSLKASFSFSSLNSQKIETPQGELSEIYIEGAYPNGNVGEPQLPMFTRLIAVPTGATPIVSVGAHSESQYTLSDYGIGTVSAMQAPVRKNVDPSTVEYAFSEAAYARNSYNEDPIATVEVLGTMRGITLGRIIVRPVRYNPVAGTVKVFNDIEVNVNFESGDEESTTQMFKNTFSPAFNSVYDQLFNIDMLVGRGGRDAYTDHPDFYNTPVRMLVICYSGFQGNSALNEWLQWKLQKGYYVDIYYTGSGSNNAGTTSSAITTFIRTKYNASVTEGNAYTYLITIGDTGQVPYYTADYEDDDVGYVASDLGYASVDYSSNSDDVFPDMYYSRISVENTTHLTNYINKVLTYEKYEFTDGGNYLNNVILVGGWDKTWTSLVARPTINYATSYYFNLSNTTYGGFENGSINATVSTGSGYTCNTPGYSGTNNGCYNGINNGTCFVNYTAHGDKQEWYAPKMTAAHVATLTNTGKYFFGVGNCCLTGNFNNTTTTYSPGSAIGANACFAETMIRVPNAGAIAYIGCSDYSIWMEDYYWAVGSGIHFNSSYNLQGTATTTNTTTGVYDAMFTDEYWNSASSLLFVGNIAVTAAENNNTGNDVSSGYKYYFKYYHTFGDGSVMPYVTKPEANSVTIPSTVTPGTTSITVNAVAGSYVAVTDNSSVIYGVAEANSSGVATVNFTNAIPGSGTLHVVVTRQQYQPYFGTIQIVGGTQYNITVNQPQHGTISAPSQAYANTTVTLTATPETGYCLSSWDVRDDSNNSITVTNNQFTMPESNVTVTASFVQGLAVTLAPVTNGSISADPLYALQGTTINLTATPAEGYEFGNWLVYKTGDANTTVTVNGDSFTMPNYPVTVSATFVLGPTELTVYDGTATNQYIPMYGYYFDNYTKGECIIPASQLTAMNGCAIFAITFYPSSVGTTNSTWTGTSQTVFLKEVSGTTLGGSYSGTSGATTVKQGLLEMPTAGEAYTITFDAPYTYNGGNLLIGVYNTAKGSYNKVEWYGTSGLGSGVSAYGNNSSSLNSVGYTAQSFLPKTTFTYMPSTTPYLSLAPNSATILTGFTETLTATYGNVSGTPSITYTSSNTSVATVSGSGTTATVTAVAPGTATITATMTVDGTPYTAMCSVTVEDPSYCEPSFSNPSDDYISKFVTTGGVTNINNTSTYVSGGYSNYYNDYSASIDAGETLNCTVTSSSTQWRYGHAIWVDWNKDYEFSSDERMAYTTSTATGNWTGSFVVPADANGGDYRMRVIHLYNNTPTDACMSGQYGEAEDYKLTVIAASTDPVEITVSANPADGGTVTGAGTYEPGTTATLTATANEGYTFTNWTKNGVVMSTNATYSFTVFEAAEYVANFTLNSYTITATANPSEGGSVTVGARTRDDLVYDFEDGTYQGWTLLKGTNGTSPNNWMHVTEYTQRPSYATSNYGHNSSTGFMLSESYISGSSSGTGTAVTPDNYLVSPQVRLGGSINFWVSDVNDDYCEEHFAVAVSTNGNTNVNDFTQVQEWTFQTSKSGRTGNTRTIIDHIWYEYTVDLSAFSGMGYVAIHHFDCYDQWMLCLDDITIVEGSDNSTGSGNFNYGETCVVTATPMGDYYFMNWTENGTVVSSSSTYTFTVTGDCDLVANFTQDPPYQIVTLSEGWSWWSTNLDITLEELKSAIAFAVGSDGTASIKFRNGTIVYNNGQWRGYDIQALDISQMCMIRTSVSCEITLTGTPVNLGDYEITICHGYNWIGFPSSESMTLEEAFGTFPVNGDVVKSRNNNARYHNGQWRGQLTDLQPGQGYIYISNVTDDRTFTYGANSKH